MDEEILECLASSSNEFKANQKTISTQLGPKQNLLLQSFNFHAALEELTDWFLLLLKNEPPPKTLAAINFGLFETKEGCQLYVTGALKYDEDDPDWACANDWWPEGRYAPSNELCLIWERFENAGTKSWTVVQSIVIVLLKEILKSRTSEIRKISRLKGVHIFTGFDDGDLFKIGNL